MKVETNTIRARTAIPARALPTGELLRATDLLLDAATDGSDPAQAAARAAVAEVADWCCVDLVGPSGELARAACVEGEHLDRAELADALGHFGAPDPVMVTRLQLAGAPVRVEDPDWLPRHRAVAAAVGDDPVRGCVVALIPRGEHDLAGDLWFAGELGRRLDQVLALGVRR